MDMGTLSYVEWLWRNTTESAVVEAIAELEAVFGQRKL